MKIKNCTTCAFDRGKKCLILKEKITENCFAWADEREAMKRELAIQIYCESLNMPALNEYTKEQIEKRRIANEHNKAMRDGKSVKQMLDERFMELYEKDLTDAEIARMLYMDKSRVSDYRSKLSLPFNKKDRPAATGAEK